eukprot:3938590-Rhodomonas_salina.7
MIVDLVLCSQPHSNAASRAQSDGPVRIGPGGGRARNGSGGRAGDPHTLTSTGIANRPRFPSPSPAPCADLRPCSFRETLS